MLWDSVCVNRCVQYKSVHLDRFVLRRVKFPLAPSNSGLIFRGPLKWSQRAHSSVNINFYPNRLRAVESHNA